MQYVPYLRCAGPTGAGVAAQMVEPIVAASDIYRDGVRFEGVSAVVERDCLPRERRIGWSRMESRTQRGMHGRIRASGALRRRLPAPFNWTLALALVAAACSGRTSSPGSLNDAGIVQREPHDAAEAEASDAIASADSPSPVPDGGGLGACAPAPAPMRRLSHVEYDNTVLDLLHLPNASAGLEIEVDEIPWYGFGNEAEGRPVSAGLVESYRTSAIELATQATASEAALAAIAPCAATITPDTAEVCAHSTVTALGTAAFRRALTTEDEAALLALHSEVRQAGGTFAEATAAVIAALLQSPEFLYRVELGTDDPVATNTVRARRPSGEEMAVRLSYLFWASLPDDVLVRAAAAGELQTAAGVRAQAVRMLDDPRAHRVVRHFFDSLFGLDVLPSLQHDPTLYPTYSPAIGQAMREETLSFAENEVFAADGSWPSLLTAPYTFVNEPLAAFYDIAGVSGLDFRKVAIDTTRRLGLLTQGGPLTGLGGSDRTNPIIRGGFIANRLLCRGISLESETLLKMVPLPLNPKDVTGRERVTTATDSPLCTQCHDTMNPLGFALENYDAVGLYREQDNGETIDAQVTVPGIDGAINGGVGLARALAQSPEAQSCFADEWVAYAYGTKLGGADACLTQTVREAFRRSGFNLKQLLIDLTQTDAFLFLPVNKE
jgi:hypothetical protein